MKKGLIFFRSFFTALESAPVTLLLWSISFLCLIAFRLGIDLSTEGLPALSFFQFFFQWAHLFLFFFFSYLVLLPLVGAIGKTSLEKAARVLLFGFLIILFPPIIDKLIFGESLYWSFYIFDSLPNLWLRFLTFFGDKPHLGITYGVRVEVAFVLIGLFLYGLAKTDTFWRTLFYTLLAYVVLFLLGTLPSWLSYITLSHTLPLLEIKDTHIAELFLSPETILGRSVEELKSALAYKMSLFLLPLSFVSALIIWYRIRKAECLAFFRNVRFPQIFYHNGLLILGMLLAIHYTEGAIPITVFTVLAFVTLSLAVTATWLTSVVWNDLYDQRIDTDTNAFRPLITGVITEGQYQTYAILLFFFSLFASALVSFQAMLLLGCYQALATLYSLPPFRLKRFLGVATLVASLACILVLFAGYTTLSPDHTLAGLPTNLILYLALIYALILPLKDFKDFTGDKADHVYTLPVVLGIPRAKVTMSTVTFLLFVSSIFVLHAPELLLWSLLFGSLSFWLIQRAGSKKSWITYPRLSFVFIVLAFGYGVGLVVFLF